MLIPRPAGVSMEVKEIDDDSGDKLCHLFGGKGATIPARKANMTPDDIVEGLDAWHKFSEKHSANKKKIIREVLWVLLPKGLKQPKFDKTTLKRCINKESEYLASSKLASSRDRWKGILRQRDGKYPDMEIKIAVKVKHLRALGLSVNKHVLKLEVQTIFHKLNPCKYP